MLKYVFLFCCFLLGLLYVHRISVYYFSVHISQLKKQSFGDFIKRALPTSFISFTILLITLTSVTYYFLGRSDLIQLQFTQKKLEASFSKLILGNSEDNTETEIYVLYKKLKKTLLDRPTDLKGFKLLVATSISLKEYRTARIAQEKVIQLSNPNVTVEEYILYLDLAFLAAGGRISLETSEMLKKAEDSYPQNEVLFLFKALEHFEKRKYQKAASIFYLLKENDKISREKLELLKQKLFQLKIIP